MNPEAGRKFGPYEIQSRVGAGGMGHVYRAWDARLHREVAVKLLNNEYAMPGMRERFLREARAASALNHPNICTVFDIGEQDGEPYLVMELLEGETLKDRIYRNTISVDELVSIGRETAEALDAAHLKGVVHRDIKPANIFLVGKPNGGIQVKVLDFGLAKFEGGVQGIRGRSLELTTAGATVGTLAYMSPEQARGESLDSRSDLFSLGVVMYEMATRHVPFQGATSALVFVQLLNHAPEPIREWNESVPRELERIILKLLAKERTARFQTAAEVDLALAAFTEKGTNWLRRAVTAVPLVRSTDPVARERRNPSRPPAEASSASPPERLTPRNAAERDSSRPSREPAMPPAADQFVRPVVRAPRSDPGVSASRRPSNGREAADAPSSSAFPGPASRGAVQLPVQRASRPGMEPLTDLPPLRTTHTAFSQTASASQTTSTNADEGLSTLYERTATQARKPWRRGLVGLALGALAVGAAAWLLHQQGTRPTALAVNNSVLLTEVENQTGDKNLDGAVAEGLQIDLAQSPYLLLRDSMAYRAVRAIILTDSQQEPALGGAALARIAAQRLGVKTYLYGTVTGAAAPYLIHVDLHETNSDKVTSAFESHALSLLQIPAAIDEVAGDIRTAMGESSVSIEQNTTALAKDGSANLEALQRYAQGEAALLAGHSTEALKALRQAATLDPKFVQPQLLRCALLSNLNAETAAADGARQALATADSSSVRTRALAQAYYEVYRSGDLPRSTSLLRSLLGTYPHDVAALALLARSLRLQGHFAEALQTAQQASSADPSNLQAYTETSDALLGMDRYDAVLSLAAQSIKLGLRPSESAQTASLLLQRQGGAFGDASATVTPAQATFDDNRGQLRTGAASWRSQAAASLQEEDLKSAAAYDLSLAAMNRALVGDCAAALPLIRETGALPMGQFALYYSGVAHGLCGEKVQAQQSASSLRERYPQSFAVSSFMLADIDGALAVHDQDADTALTAMRSTRASDLIAVTPLLRGLAHTQLHQLQVGVVDFQAVLTHRGAAYLTGSTIYPVAEIGVARAFAFTGDEANSRDAYNRFLDLWLEADAASPLVAEARMHLASE